MDFNAPLTAIFNQGLVGAMAVLEAAVIVWLVRAREKDKTELIASYDQRRADAATLANTSNTSINQFTDALKDNNRQSEQILAASNAIAQSVQQLVFRKESS